MIWIEEFKDYEDCEHPECQAKYNDEQGVGAICIECDGYFCDSHMATYAHSVWPKHRGLCVTCYAAIEQREKLEPQRAAAKTKELAA